MVGIPPHPRASRRPHATRSDDPLRRHGRVRGRVSQCPGPHPDRRGRQPWDSATGTPTGSCPLYGPETRASGPGSARGADTGGGGQPAARKAAGGAAAGAGRRPSGRCAAGGARQCIADRSWPWSRGGTSLVGLREIPRRGGQHPPGERHRGDAGQAAAVHRGAEHPGHRLGLAAGPGPQVRVRRAGRPLGHLDAAAHRARAHPGRHHQLPARLDGARPGLRQRRAGPHRARPRSPGSSSGSTPPSPRAARRACGRPWSRKPASASSTSWK